MGIPTYFNDDASANPGLETGNMRLAAMLENEVAAQLADLASIRKSGALRFLGDVSGSGSDAVRMRFAAWGAKTPFVSANEYDDVDPTTLSTSTAVCTVARSSLRWNISDLASLTGFGSDLDPFSLGASLAASCEARINEIICATFASASASAGVSAAALSVDDFLDAQFALELKSNTGEIYAILHPKQVNHLKDSLRGESNNAIGYNPATADMIKFLGQGVVGTLLGCTVFKSDAVKLDGPSTNRVGMMMSAGGVAYAVGTPGDLVGSGGSIRPAGSPCLIEFQRDSSKVLTEIVGHLYAGAAISEQDRVCKIVSSAT